ncbi:MAG: zinc ribbon domain-containing protein [Myxococcota bacterium]|nr:zinc ribbon domain-containing protein [Myxococcota bacterium]
MPMYEYQCSKCGYSWELIQRMSDAPPKTCPECRSRKVGKMMSRTSFVLKGSGWYADGYSGKSNKRGSSGSDGSPSTSSD